MKLGRIFNCFETLLTQWAMNLELHELNDFVIRYVANKEVNRAKTLRRKGQFFFCAFASLRALFYAKRICKTELAENKKQIAGNYSSPATEDTGKWTRKNLNPISECRE